MVRNRAVRVFIQVLLMNRIFNGSWCPQKSGYQAILAAMLSLTAFTPDVLAANNAAIQLELDGRTIQGKPLAWNSSEVLLLAPNGYLFRFSPDVVKNYRQVTSDFRPWSQRKMRGQLLREFGREFEVSGSGNYLVVHPAGERDRWVDRFDFLHRAFVHYFSVRGMQPSPPAFPLVAVVFHSRKEFRRHAAQSGASVSPGVIGYYAPHSNRVIIYDITRGQSTDENWPANAAIIIHEATHQMAFNTRVHSRFAEPPRWVAEGLAMLFEAPGVWNPHYHPDLEDRINRTRLDTFREYARNRPSGSLPQFLSQSAREFARTPDISYAQAWAFSFFLSEKEPTRYVEYLQKTASREPLKTYSDSERLSEFVAVFGQDLRMQEARFLRFIDQLP